MDNEELKSIPASQIAGDLEKVIPALEMEARRLGYRDAQSWFHAQDPFLFAPPEPD